MSNYESDLKTTGGSLIRLDLYSILNVTQYYACAIPICKVPLTYTLFISVVRYSVANTDKKNISILYHNAVTDYKYLYTGKYKPNNYVCVYFN